jgi:hypothetical protein
MKPINLLTISLILAAAWLPACSGSHGAGGGGGGGNQNANLVLTMTSSPSVSLSNISILSAIVDVSGITLNPATGNPVPLPLHPAVYPVDLMRLQSDSAFLGSIAGRTDLQQRLGHIFSSSSHYRQSIRLHHQRHLPYQYDLPDRFACRLHPIDGCAISAHSFRHSTKRHFL